MVKLDNKSKLEQTRNIYDSLMQKISRLCNEAKDELHKLNGGDDNVILPSGNKQQKE